MSRLSCRIALAILLIALPAAAAGTPRRALSPEQLRLLPTAADGLRLLTRDAQMTEHAISPRACADCPVDGVQDATDISFHVVATDTIRAQIYVVRASTGQFFGDVQRLTERAPGLTYTFAGFDAFFAGNPGNPLDDFALPDDDYQIIIRAYDDTNRVEADTLALEVDRVRPILSSLAFRDGRTSYRNGDTIVIDARLDREAYRVSANFSGIDSDTAGGTSFTDRGDGQYEIRHTISMTNMRPDAADSLVRIGFRDLAGNRLEFNALRPCLSNRPPTLVSIRTLNNPDGAYRAGDRIEVETVWDSDDTLLTMTPDFRGVDSNYDSVRVATARSPGNRYVSSYTLSDANTLTDGTYYVSVTARDRGCGVSPPALVPIVFDNEAGARPVLDALPNAVRTDRVTVGGTAPGSIRVDIRRNNTLVDTARVGEDGRFAKAVPLLAGNNSLIVEGFDSAGNKTTPSLAVTIFYVVEATLTIPAPFRPGSAFQVATARPASRVRIELWTLGGDLAAVLEDDTPRDLYTVAWNGADASGTRLNSGPLVALIRVEYTDGTDDVQKRAFVLAPPAAVTAP
jgi:hypothetical protein